MENSTVADSIPLRHTALTIVILVTAYLTVLIVGIVGNFCVIMVVMKMPKMKTATKYFILNLAVADLLVLIFCLVPNLISSIYVPWVLSSLLCKAVPYIQGLSVCVSVYSLATISGDRFMAIEFPLRRQVPATVARRIVVLIWIWGAGLALPWLLFFDLSNADGSGPSLVFCIESWPPGINGNIYFVLVNLGLFYLLPLTFISFCHFIIWLRMRRRPVHADSSLPHRGLTHERSKTSVEKFVVAVVVGFAVCWLPLYAIFVRVKLIPVVLDPTEEKVLDYALPIAQWLGAANSCMNPILYGFFNRNFRLTLQGLLHGCVPCTTPRNHPTPHHNNHRNLGAGHGRNFVRLCMTFRRSNSKSRQLSNTRHSDAESAV